MNVIFPSPYFEQTFHRNHCGNVVLFQRFPAFGQETVLTELSLRKNGVYASACVCFSCSILFL